MITPSQITNAFDGNLAILLGALLMRRDLPTEFVGKSWDDVLGTLARRRMRIALIESPMYRTRRYRLGKQVWERFPDADPLEDHVFPLDAWKDPLLARAKHENWHIDAASLSALRTFVLQHYVTAEIPAPLHHPRVLPRNRMPTGWRYEEEQSLWARYRTSSVTELVGRPLRVPGEADSDFESI
ncbi:MAG: hypothetical protein JWQ07_4079 [Ramlibacter sp.]|nr:hypothetical protein [Ramlibacter sp.]